MRFTLPTPVRKYAFERLEAAGELERVRAALGKAASDVSVASAKEAEAAQQASSRTRGGRPNALSTRERDIVVLIAMDEAIARSPRSW
jgi:hypothetical protein